LEGRLVDETDCLWIEADGFRWLILWPADSSAVEDGEQVIVRNGGHEAVVGTQISAAGGEYNDEHFEFVRMILTAPLPQACRSSGLYWLGYDIQSLSN
jgi:hypothetical protein